MKDLSIYFQPITTAVPFNESQLGSYIDANNVEFPELNEPGCAIFEVPEYRGSVVGFGIQNTDFREHLYALHPETSWDKKIYDLGTILRHGLQHKIEEVFAEIQSSNMSKLDENGKPIYREDGKVLKSELYFKPDIAKILAQ